MARRKMPVREDAVEIVEPLTILEPVPPEKDGPIKLAVSNCRVLNLRKEASQESKVLLQIPNGGVITVDEMVDDWFHVCEYLGEAVDGYILAQYATEV